MADWNGYRRAVQIDTLKAVAQETTDLREIARGFNPEQRGQRRMAGRILERISDRILELEAEGHTAVYQHYKPQGEPA